MVVHFNPGRNLSPGGRLNRAIVRQKRTSEKHFFHSICFEVFYPKEHETNKTQTKYSCSGIDLGSKDCGFEIIQQKPECHNKWKSESKEINIAND